MLPVFFNYNFIDSTLLIFFFFVINYFKRNSFMINLLIYFLKLNQLINYLIKQKTILIFSLDKLMLKFAKTDQDRHSLNN